MRSRVQSRKGRNRFPSPKRRARRSPPKEKWFKSHSYREERRREPESDKYASPSSQGEGRRHPKTYTSLDSQINQERPLRHRPLRSVSPRRLENSERDVMIDHERSFVEATEYGRQHFAVHQKPPVGNSKDEIRYDESFTHRDSKGENNHRRGFMEATEYGRQFADRQSPFGNLKDETLYDQRFKHRDSNVENNHERRFVEATEYVKQFINHQTPPFGNSKDGTRYDERFTHRDSKDEVSHERSFVEDAEYRRQFANCQNPPFGNSKDGTQNDERFTHRDSKDENNHERNFVEVTEYGREFANRQNLPFGNSMDGARYDERFTHRDSKDEIRYDERFKHRDSALMEYHLKCPKQEPPNGSADGITTLNYKRAFDPSMPRFSQSSEALDGREIYVHTSSHLDDKVGRTLFRVPPSNDNPEINSGIVGGDIFSSTPGGSDVGLYKDAGLLYRDHQNPTKFPSREYYKGDEKAKYSPRGAFNTMMLMSQSKGFQSTSTTQKKEEPFGGSINRLPFPSEELQNCDLKLGAPHSESARDQQDVVYSLDPLNGTFGAENCDYGYHVVGRKEKDDFAYVTAEAYRKIMQQSTQRDYENKVSTRRNSTGLNTDAVNDIKCSDSRFTKVSIREHQSLEEEPIPEYLNINRNSLATRDVESLTTGSKYLEFGARVCPDRDSSHSKKGYDFGTEAGSESCKERLSPPRLEYNPDMYRLDMSQRQTLEVDNYNTLDRVQKRKYNMDVEISKHDLRITPPSSGNICRQLYEYTDVTDNRTDEALGALPSSRGSAFSRLEYKKNRCPSHERASDRVHESQPRSSHGQGFGVERHILDGQKLSINKPLRPTLVNLLGPNHQEGKHNFHKPDKYHKRSVNDQHGSTNADNGSPSRGKVLSVNRNPSEDSEEFRQLVHKAFLRFSKHLNETSAQRRRYKEQGKAGFLLCSVCHSHRKEQREFVDTRSLVSHTFSSSNVGLRADHLGLHKAICVLMGWNSDVASSNTWVQEVLPDSEALALKENLILWPPMVIIHNSSIGNKNAEQKVVSVEQMEAILRDLGFSTGTTVCRGKPANQSIMVIKFKPTISGLKEAERLHNHYAEKKRGRGEFQQISSNISNNRVESKGADTDSLELVLYGYLGIADDLDKLEIETKKRCVVKSKKEIQTVADAPLNTE